MQKRDYYDILRVAKSAGLAEIKKAYRRCALDNHPDRNPGNHEAEERFKEASEAYGVLSDPQKRQLYDSFGHRGLEERGFAGFHDVEEIFGSFGNIFADLFGDIGFGVGRRAHRKGSGGARAGAHLEIELAIGFEEAALGGEREVTVERAAQCATCHGNGAQPGTSRQTCSACDGIGHVTSRRGFFVMQSTCPTCQGEGTRIQHLCEECRGQGAVRERKTLKIRIPAGIEEGMQLVLHGEGHAGVQGGHSGDLYVVIHVESHPQFSRHGDDILLRVSISFPEAALGTRLTVPTLYGKQEIKIAPGTDAGTTVRLKGAGIQNVRGRHKGDQCVEIQIATPKHLTPQQRALLEEFHESTKQ